MNKLATKAKAICALAGSVLTAVVGAGLDNKPLAIAAAVLTALAVYQVPNQASE